MISLSLSLSLSNILILYLSVFFVFFTAKLLAYNSAINPVSSFSSLFSLHFLGFFFLYGAVANWMGRIFFPGRLLFA